MDRAPSSYQQRHSLEREADDPLPGASRTGAATTDSDIFVANVDDLLDGVEPPRNLTNSQGEIDDDPDWSPDGQRIVYTRHPDSDDQLRTNGAEIYVINADGTGTPTRLTDNNESERGPAWSPDGTRIAYACRIGGGTNDHEICVMNADGTGQVQLTDNVNLNDLTPPWSPTGKQLVFGRAQIDPPGPQHLWTMNANGTGQKQLTHPPGTNLAASWGELRVKLDD